MYIIQSIEKGLRRSITHWFQPIYHLKADCILGYEALMRDASKIKVPPVELFREAERQGLRTTLDLVSVKAAIEQYNNDTHPIFINVFPSTLLERGFLFWWDLNVKSTTPVVLEILESEPIRNWSALKQVTDELKERGVRLAVDDMGGGYSFFQQWIELTPDYIKLDRYFAENLSVSIKKQETLKSLVNLLSDTTSIIIEGVEKKEDLSMAESLGIVYAQGFLLGKPSPRE